MVQAVSSLEVPMIQLKVTMTGKGYHPSSEWQHLSSTDDHHSFPDMDAAKEWLKEQYGTCKRVPMYCDPDAKQVGYIYSFRASDISHVPVNKWIQQDWVEFREVRAVTP